MFFKNYQILFLFTLISGSLISVSANSWFTSWFGLEVNLMSMIPLMLSNLNHKSTEASIKYFLSQAMASILLILAIIMKFYLQELINLEYVECLIFFSLALKAGLAPLHFWFPQVTMSLNWTQCLIILTWQKVAPLLLLCALSFKLLIFTSIFSALVGSLGGFNQKNLKLLLTYSSISHGAWMILACLISTKIWMIYFSIYTFLSFSIILFFYNQQIFYISEIFTSNNSFLSKIIILMNLLSLGGLPPFLGFSAKLMVILIILKSKILALMIPLIVSSLISLFFYFRVIYSSLMNKNTKMNLYLLKANKTMSFYVTLSIFFNLSVPLFYIFS